VAYVQDDFLNTEAVVIEDQASGDAIEIQRALEFDDQDAALGMDTYCLVRGGASHYGGITRWIVLSDLLQLELEEGAAIDLALPATVIIPIDEPSADLLRKHLPALCAPSG
jgi:Immunity protein 10